MIRGADNSNPSGKVCFKMGLDNIIFLNVIYSKRKYNDVFFVFFEVPLPVIRNIAFTT